MATTKVTTRKVTLGTEAIKRAAARDPRVLKQLENQFRRFTGREMANVVTDHFQEAIGHAARLVDDGVPGAESGAAPTVRTRFGAVVISYWSALTSRYRASKKRNFAGTEGLFWKRSGATGKYLLKVSTGVKSARLSKVKAEPSSATARAQVRVSSTITTPFTGDPVIDGLMRNSFVQGEPTFVRGSAGKNLTPAGIVAVMEAGKGGQPPRPLISQLAAALGIRAQQALRKIKQ